MRRFLLVLSAAVLAPGFSARVGRTEGAPQGAIKVCGYGKKPAVTFDHEKHADVACEGCHHTRPSGADGYQCCSCHGFGDSEETKAPRLQDAVHGKGKGKCFGCHLSQRATKRLRCADCHKG